MSKFIKIQVNKEELEIIISALQHITPDDISIFEDKKSPYEKPDEISNSEEKS